MREGKVPFAEGMKTVDGQQDCDEPTPEQAIAHAVLMQRMQMKMTQTELAERMGVPQGNVSRLESGMHTPTLATLMRAAEALNVPLEIRFGAQVISLARMPE